MKKLLVTCALPYANGAIHIGHLVEYIQADIWVRYWKLRGRETAFLCADDTHGTPIMLKARSENITPEELIERTYGEHLRDFTAFGVVFDDYYSTHSPENRELAGEIFLRLEAEQHIVQRAVQQAYCTVDEMFLPDRYIRGTCPNCGALDQYGDSCEVCAHFHSSRELIAPHCANCGSPPSWRDSDHFFLRLSDFNSPLRDWLAADHVQPEVRKKLTEWFDAGLKDWDISRDSPYFGFEIPGHSGKFFYVWLDAPVGYMATTLHWLKGDRGAFAEYWRRDDRADIVHFIGKDIIYFHGLFWPATLMGAGFRTPSELAVHGFLTVNGEKMSKARGTFITAEDYARRLDPQYLRYYYASKLTARVEDLDLNFEDFVLRVNAELVNKLANIPSRAVAILYKRCAGILAPAGRMSDVGRALVADALAGRETIAKLYERRELSQVVRRIVELADRINVYLQDGEPWNEVAVSTAEAAAICTTALNAFRIASTYLLPVLPAFAGGVAALLGLPALTWEGLPDMVEDRPVTPYKRLVERMDRTATASLTAVRHG